MATKKLLVPVDLEKPNKKISGFLYPNMDSECGNSFLEINKGEVWQTGMVVFVGKKITKHDVFSKIVDSGREIESVDDLLENIDIFLTQIKSFKIGDIVGLKSLEKGFELIKLDKPKKKNNKNLP